MKPIKYLICRVFAFLEMNTYICHDHICHVAAISTEKPYWVLFEDGFVGFGKLGGEDEEEWHMGVWGAKSSSSSSSSSLFHFPITHYNSTPFKDW